MLSDTDREHFDERGYVRVPDAFTTGEAEAMRDVVWRALANQGILRDDPATWTNEFPSHLQSLKDDDVFKPIGSERTLSAIDDLIGVGRWKPPSDWGAFFLLFPTRRAWSVPWNAWHLDHDYTSPLAPLDGLKVHSMFGDVAPRAGGMTVLTGSHRVVAQNFAAKPPRAGAKGAQIRKQLMRSHPYLRALGTDGEPGARIARFLDRDEEVLGVPLRVVELTANAGDVILIHPLLLHTPPDQRGGPTEVPAEQGPLSHWPGMIESGFAAPSA